MPNSFSPSALLSAITGGQRPFGHLSDRALLESIMEGITLILTGEHRIMDGQNQLATTEAQIADDIQDFSTHFDTIDANMQALKDANANGNQDAVAAEAAKIEAQLAVFRAKVDADPNAQTQSGTAAPAPTGTADATQAQS